MGRPRDLVVLAGALLAAGALLTGALGCAGEAGTTPGSAGPPAPAPAGPALVNDAWRIVKMATAHDIFTIEVEVVDIETASALARELIAPLEDRYQEVLVYVYAAGEGEGGHVPVKRIQWTAAGGVVELDYRTPPAPR